MPASSAVPPFPRPDTPHPVRLSDGSAHPGTVFLKPLIDHPRWEIGDYSYASAHTPPADWAGHLAPYLYPFSPERLVIGRFCQIADGVQFITSSANHRYDGISSFPFAIFGGGPADRRPSMPEAGPDTVIGHDVWIGTRATILPGARIGSGCIVGAGAVVGGTVPPYSIVAGNPGRVIRRRFADAEIARLLDLAWWDWPIDRILAHEGAICGGDPAALSAVAETPGG
jgi:virginiamycin A acetyltransferase